MSKKSIVCIKNLVNGNLTTAKKQAERLTATCLFQTAMEDFGFTERRANKAARYLKNPSQETFQAYCDADFPVNVGEATVVYNDIVRSQLRPRR